MYQVLKNGKPLKGAIYNNIPTLKKTLAMVAKCAKRTGFDCWDFRPQKTLKNEQTT